MAFTIDFAKRWFRVGEYRPGELVEAPLPQDVELNIMANGFGAGNSLQNMSAQNAYNQMAANHQQTAMQQQVYQGVAQSAPQEPSLLQKLMTRRQRAKAKDKVLEFFQAQLELDLFKDDMDAQMIWHRAIKAAWDNVEEK